MAKKKKTLKKTKTQSSEDSLYTKLILGNIKKHTLPDTNSVVTASSSNSGFTIAENVKLKSGFNRRDKELKNPGTALPTTHQDIILMTHAIYRKVGLIRNIIDLMSDFASEGLTIRHPIKKQQRFYEAWAEKVDLQGRSHDFMKLLLRDANVIVRRKDGILTDKIIKMMTKGSTNLENLLVQDVEEKPEKIDVKKTKRKKKVIPWRYIFLSPTMIEKTGGEVGKFFNGNAIAMRIPRKLVKSIKSPKTDSEKALKKRLPTEVLSAIDKSKGASVLVELDPERVYVDYYKKDDWEDWGTPFLYGIFDDIILKEKMKLADMSALDGVINTIRLWRLGDHKEQILPNPNAVNKLLDILQHNQGGGVLDLVWDSMIDMKVEYPPIDKILGNEKYKSVNSDIIQGLGIPNALLGGVDLATRNAETAFVQLKTLIERLEYVRHKCLKWLRGEIKLVSEAMGFKKLPFINFGTMSLRDEAVEKQLMIQLVDRGIISIEAVHEVFGTNFVVELERMREEQDIRDTEPKILEKGNPYYRPISVMELQNKLQIELQDAKLSGQTGDNPNGDQPTDEGDNDSGRPPNTKDTEKRDDKRQPVLSSDQERALSVYKTIAEKHMKQIDSIIDPLYIKKNNIKNIRFLTKAQAKELEKIKRHILSTISLKDNPEDISQTEIAKRTDSSSEHVDRMTNFENLFNKTVSYYKNVIKQNPKLNDRKSLASSTWAMLVITKDTNEHSCHAR